MAGSLLNPSRGRVRSSKPQILPRRVRRLDLQPCVVDLCSPDVGPNSIWSSAFCARGSAVVSRSLVVELTQLASCLQLWMSATLDCSQTPPLDAASPAPASLLLRLAATLSPCTLELLPARAVASPVRPCATSRRSFQPSRARLPCSSSILPWRARRGCPFPCRRLAPTGSPCARCCFSARRSPLGFSPAAPCSVLSAAPSPCCSPVCAPLHSWSPSAVDPLAQAASSLFVVVEPFSVARRRSSAVGCVLLAFASRA
jgi:hypothetical protein